MPANDIDLLSINRGTVTAPAGCGKTHLIAAAVARHTGAKPILVLTHTNAGVAALRGRLGLAGAPSKAYCLSTIDGWAMKIIATFPLRSAHDPNILKPVDQKIDYAAIRTAAMQVVKTGHVSDILVASYARLIVDEYQDCAMQQHLLVTHTADILPVCALADPMQALFSFGGNKPPEWDEVCRTFPIAGELTMPWRWINAGAEDLGRWLLDVRARLERGQAIDLRTAPAAVRWVELDGKEDHRRQSLAARVRPQLLNGHVLIIGDSANPNAQARFASQTPGAVAVEAVELRDLVSLSLQLDIAGPDALEQIVTFGQSVMINAGAKELLKRIRVLTRSTARKRATDAENAALAFVRAPSYGGAAEVLLAIRRKADVRAYRPASLKTCIKALQICHASSATTFHDAAVRMREENRLMGRPLPKRAVGSTLLLKGLQAEVAVILNADALDTRNLYVAMTRGSTALAVCSRQPVLHPKS